MSSISARLKSSRMAVTTAATLLFAVLACSEAVAQNSGVGRIVGNIDGISQDGDQLFISGWACQQGQKKSILVHVFADRSAFDTPKGTFMLAGEANFDSEPAVAQACQDREGGQHRFLIALPREVLAIGRERKLYVHGIRVVGDVANEAISGSGTQLAHLPGTELRFPGISAFPTLMGAYHSLAEHPRVFTTAAEIKELASRINRPGSYSMQRFGQLAGQIKGDLGSRIDWDATYSGCDIDIYLHAFSSEPRGGYASETRTEDQLRAAMKVRPGAALPAGAALVAARLALYAALVKAGAAAPAGAPGADQAAALAKQILRAWSEHGLRDQHGHFLTYSQFCDGNGKPTNPELHMSRGLVYSVQAHDLLMYLGALSDGDVKELMAFHSAMYELIRKSYNAGMASSQPACMRYANGSAAALVSLMAMARLMDDRPKFDAALYGVERSNPVLLPWIRYIDGAIYGESDSPAECGDNRSPDSLTSLANHDGYFMTPGVAPGEVVDRYRNLGSLQGIGYPMGTLGGLMNMAEMMRIAGFDSLGYRGRHRQSIEMAINYYACLAKGAGFYKVVTAANSGACPNAAQYYGKLVNNVDKIIIGGAYRFPKNALITDLDAAAKIALPTTPYWWDSITFGRWKD